MAGGGRASSLQDDVTAVLAWKNRVEGRRATWLGAAPQDSGGPSPALGRRRKIERERKEKRRRAGLGLPSAGLGVRLGRTRKSGPDLIQAQIELINWLGPI